jgi:hypothetical protein
VSALGEKRRQRVRDGLCGYCAEPRGRSSRYCCDPCADRMNIHRAKSPPRRVPRKRAAGPAQIAGRPFVRCERCGGLPWADEAAAHECEVRSLRGMSGAWALVIGL